MGWSGYGWRPYVPVAKRRAQATQKMAALKKKGVDVQPVQISGRKIAKTFWGEAWCNHLESFSDYANRLPRGRTYVRNGSVCHLEIKQGEIRAKVAGQDIYDVQIKITTLPKKTWEDVKQRCAGQVGSLIELLQGKLSKHVMQVVTDRKDGLFPAPREISLKCNCPDWATMCKHVAAVMYGVGARLDEQPELLFQLRGVDHEELIAADAEAAVSAATTRGTSKRLVGDDLGDVFGIDIEAEEVKPRKKRAAKKPTAKPAARKKATKKKAAVKKKTTKKKAAKKAVKKTSAKKKVTKKSAKRPAAPKKKSTRKKATKK